MHLLNALPQRLDPGATPTFAGLISATLTSPASTNLTLGTGTYGTALTVASATGAVTATTTLADQGGTIAAQRNGLAPAQGLAFDGTARATLTNLPAFGTADFSVCLMGVQPTAATGYLLGAPTNGLEIYFYNSGANIAIDAGGVGSMAISAGFGNTTTPFNLTVTRSSGVLRAYRDGIEFTLTAGAISQATNLSAASTRLGSSGLDTFLFTGALRPVGIYNRALSAAEVLALYQTGAVASADYNTASNTSLLTVASSSGWTQSGTVVFSGGVTVSSGGYIYQTPLVWGKKYRYNIVVSAVTGSIGVYDLGGAARYLPDITATGTYSGEFTVSSSTTNSQAATKIFSLAAFGGNFTVTSLSLTPLGALLAPDSNNAGAGLEWLDVSGNRAHIILPTSGVSWSLPSSQQIVIEASTATNGNQQLGGASLIDANKQWRIQSWTVNCSTGTPTISLGNVSAGTQYNAAAVLAAGNNDITLLARFPSTANLWVNSSTTATLIHRITLVPAN